uniref:cell wall protein IFF6-like isoform X1 n=1 Tax=Styela clava TaxID=7725 RepID=UPI001939CECA|nr:cell wall protein IFF6-like isoform X1 [Styela clava]
MKVYCVLLFIVLAVAAVYVDATLIHRIRRESSGDGKEGSTTDNGSGCLGDDEDCVVTVSPTSGGNEGSASGHGCTADDEDCGVTEAPPTDGPVTDDGEGSGDTTDSPGDGSNETGSGDGGTGTNCLEDDEDCSGSGGGTDHSGEGSGEEPSHPGDGE